MSKSGWEMLKERRVVVSRGDRVLIVGAPGTGKTQLFRALAGLWPWGNGTITRPRDEQILYLPNGTPYLPRGTLREVLAYPQKTERFDAAAFGRALERLGLAHLTPQLDATRRWDRELSQDEQQSLAFARIVLQAPAWVLMDDGLGALEDEALERITDVFTHDLQHTSVINIGRAAQAHHPLFSRVLHLVKAPPKPAGAREVAAGHAAEQRIRQLAIVKDVPDPFRSSLIVLLLLMAPAAFAQDLEFRPPQSAADASIPGVMRDLAVRVLPVYQERDAEKYLSNLFALQLVAGDPTPRSTRASRCAIGRRRPTPRVLPIGRCSTTSMPVRAPGSRQQDSVSAGVHSRPTARPCRS